MRQNTLVLIGFGGLAILGLMIVGFSWFASTALHRLSAPQVVTWDFRRGPHTISEVNWPASNSRDLWDQKGEFDLTIVGPKGDVIFHQRVQHFICERKGNELENTYVHFATGSDGEQAYQILKNVMTDWQFPSPAFRDLEKWHEGIAKHMPMGAFINLHKGDREYQPALYPDFEAGKAGSVGVRASDTGSRPPEDGVSTYTLSLSF